MRYLLALALALTVSACEPAPGPPPVTPSPPPVEPPLPPKPPEEPEPDPEPDPEPPPGPDPEPEPPPEPAPTPVPPAPVRPDPDKSQTVLGPGNPWFTNNFPAFAPAFWADGQDRQFYHVIVRDADGHPMPDVPVTVASLRPKLVAPDGTDLGETVVIVQQGARTDVAGRVTGYVVSDTSGHVFTARGHDFAFALKVEADGVRLADIRNVKAETVVASQEQMGRVEVHPASAPPGVEREIRVRAVGHSLARDPGGPVAGAFVDVRDNAGHVLEGLKPAPGHSWRTDASGWTTLLVTPGQEHAGTNRTIRAYADGKWINVPSGLHVT